MKTPSELADKCDDELEEFEVDHGTSRSVEIIAKYIRRGQVEVLRSLKSEIRSTLDDPNGPWHPMTNGECAEAILETKAEALQKECES